MQTNRIKTNGHLTLISRAVFIFAACIDAVSPFKLSGWMKSPHRRPIMDKLVESQRNGFSMANIPRGGDGEADANDLERRERAKRSVIIIDVDNTLYSEQDLVSSMGDGIESQIVQNTHSFGRIHFNLTPEQCDDLYKKYGSTIEGLRHTLPSDQVEETMARFYRDVYDPIDFSCLLGIRKSEATQEMIEDDRARSGYDHGKQKQRRALAEFLKYISKIHPVYLASNSPKAHIIRAVNNMGLSGVDFAGVLSPDMVGKSTQSGLGNHETTYPTKSSPKQYYKQILDRHPPSSNRIILLDDSLHNIHQAQSVGIEGVRINQSGRTLEEGLAQALGHILPPEPTDNVLASNQYTFSDIQYLRAKNKVDMQAINPSVWKQLAQQLALRIQHNTNGTLRIADLGAGMLSMLELILAGGGSGDREKESMLTLLKHILDPLQENDGTRRSVTKIEYFAYESNSNLLKGCKEKLLGMGFQNAKDNLNGNGVSFTSIISESGNDVEITVHLRPSDFQDEQNPPKGLDIIIGCCFADLFDPDQLALSLHRFALGESPPLVYFPITFAGTTQFRPAHPPFASQSLLRNQMIPSDTTAFRLYSESLASHGHNLDPSLIVNSVCDHGGSLLSRGISDWVIDPSLDNYLWETMMYFFGMTGAREMTKYPFDAAGWIKRCRSNRRTIIASNVDLLFHLQPDFCDYEKYRAASSRRAEGDNSTAVSVQEIQFVAPYNVTTVTKRWDTTGSSHLSPDQVEIESLCSLISSGTELKIFRGSFESASLDVNIKGMADESMEYPLAYGYSLVGRVVACGSNVDGAESLIGRLVFAFSPHSSRVIVDRGAIQLVPDGINAEDAVFMPSVETALSLVQDAHIRMGENVAVYGQGLIGLLVTSILSMTSSPLASSSDIFSSVTAFDALDDRISVSNSLGATSALKPNAVSLAGPFDVSIEVSGNPRALQSAIDHTSNNGRVIVGSWYGNTDVALKLGIDFHRSHKTIQTSQVSTIPSTLAGLWTKERRFALTWALVRVICPSRLITKQLTLNDAQQAYELLDGGKEIAICFKYDSQYTNEDLPLSKL